MSLVNIETIFHGLFLIDRETHADRHEEESQICQGEIRAEEVSCQKGGKKGSDQKGNVQKGRQASS